MPGKYTLIHTGQKDREVAEGMEGKGHVRNSGRKVPQDVEADLAGSLEGER